MRGYNLDEIYKLFFFNFQKKKKKNGRDQQSD